MLDSFPLSTIFKMQMQFFFFLQFFNLWGAGGLVVMGWGRMEGRESGSARGWGVWYGSRRTVPHSPVLETRKKYVHRGWVNQVFSSGRRDLIPHSQIHSSRKEVNSLCVSGSCREFVLDWHRGWDSRGWCFESRMGVALASVCELRKSWSLGIFMRAEDPRPNYPRCPGLGVSVGDRGSWTPRPTAFNQDSGWACGQGEDPMRG